MWATVPAGWQCPPAPHRATLLPSAARPRRTAQPIPATPTSRAGRGKGKPIPPVLCFLKGTIAFTALTQATECAIYVFRLNLTFTGPSATAHDPIRDTRQAGEKSVVRKTVWIEKIEINLLQLQQSGSCRSAVLTAVLVMKLFLQHQTRWKHC